MKNKGFTLVELLAVIAILALLVIIALPNVLKMFNQAKKDTFLTEAKNIYKEIILINVGLLIITITCGVVLHYGFHLTMSDAFFGSIPGGMTSIPLIAMEYGANPVNVTLLQFVRLIVGVGLFPKMIVNHLGLNSNVNLENKEQKVSRKKSYHWERELDEWKKTLLTLMITFISVIILEQINFPLGTLVIAILVSALYNVVTNKGHVKEELYSVAQLFLGTYIGSVVKIGDIPAIHTLILPIIAVAIVFTVGSFLLGMFLKKFTSFTETEAYFSAIPAGAADLGLITHELGIFSSKIIVVQVARVLIVTSIFPPILNIIINLL